MHIYKTSDGYKINHVYNINKIIKKYNMNKTKLLRIPWKKITKYERNSSNLINAKRYKSLLRSLLCIAVKSRLDIMSGVNESSRIYENPTEADYKNLMNILQYLKGQKIDIYIIIKI